MVAVCLTGWQLGLVLTIVLVLVLIRCGWP